MLKSLGSTKVGNFYRRKAIVLWKEIAGEVVAVPALLIFQELSVLSKSRVFSRGRGFKLLRADTRTEFQLILSVAAESLLNV